MPAYDRQYWRLKKNLFDTIFFYKMGAFYALYETDADIGKNDFDLHLTERVNMRMVGVPESSFKHWASKFVANGYKVARVEQMETPEELKIRLQKKIGPQDNVVRREVRQIYTAGTLVDQDMISNIHTNHYLLCVVQDKNNLGICFADTSTAEFNIGRINDDFCGSGLETLVQQISPKEIIFGRGSLTKNLLNVMCGVSFCKPVLNPRQSTWNRSDTLNQIEARGYFKELPPVLSAYKDDDLVMSAFGTLVNYLYELRLDEETLTMANIRSYDITHDSSHLTLDGQTLINLEILSSKDNGIKGSLLEYLDKCSTPSGRRLFRYWVCHPLRHQFDISNRIGAVDQIEMNFEHFENIIPRVTGDLERNLSRIHAQTCVKSDEIMFDVTLNKKRVILLLDTLQCLKIYFDAINNIQHLIRDGLVTNKVLLNVVQVVPMDKNNSFGFPDLQPLLTKFETMFDHQLARQDGHILPCQGANPDFDKANAHLESIQSELDQHLSHNIKTLKLSTKDCTYKMLQRKPFQIQVPKNTKVPKSWVLVSQTSQVERYHSPEVIRLMPLHQQAKEKRDIVLRGELRRIMKVFDDDYESWNRCMSCIAELDCLLSLTRTSMNNGMCKVEFVDQPEPFLDLVEMSHPCVNTDQNPFVPNSTLLGPSPSNPLCIVVTGANAGGKSTLLRQNAVAVIMAQLGCRIPATSCRMTAVDRIFTRVGASDRIMTGQSTFMVELTETSNILRNATCNSLVILDELGRGTSTFDGFSIAYATLRYLSEVIQCRTLFSTHYFHLTNQLMYNPYVSLYQMQVMDDPNRPFDVTFLYKFIPGVSPASYGLSVASKAGIPISIVQRAKQIAHNFEHLLRIDEVCTDPAGSASVLTNQQRECFEIMMGHLMRGEESLDVWKKLQEEVLALYRVYSCEK
ncbi:DNA mismatch repair protein MSH6 [Acrasis kona]|uniref:DNA mismatch repair protein MSH6 n=1 Tax=Acrasis kona TaxID=1008807 RepID=A0AAW2YYE7_9EUKA